MSEFGSPFFSISILQSDYTENELNESLSMFGYFTEIKAPPQPHSTSHYNHTHLQFINKQYCILDYYVIYIFSILLPLSRVPVGV